MSHLSVSEGRAAILTLLVLSVACAHADISVDFISQIAVSPNREFAAIAESGEGTIERVTLVRLADGERITSFETTHLAAFLDTPSVEGMSWAPDGALLKIDLSDRDVERRVLVVQPRQGATLRAVTVRDRSAVAARWGTTGQMLFVVLEGPEPEDYPSGLFALDMRTGNAKPVIDDRPVTAILDVAADRLVVRVPFDPVRKLPAAVLEVRLPSFERRLVLSAPE